MTFSSNRSANKIESILNAATGLFCNYGYDKVSVDEIARSANTTKVTLYKYFESKEKLYIEVVSKLLIQVIDDYEKIIYDSCNFKLKLSNLIKLKFKEYRSTGKLHINDIYQFLSHEQIERVNELTRMFHNQGRSEGYIDDQFSDDDLNDYFEIVINGTIMKYGGNYYEQIDESKIQSIINLVYYGVLKRDK